MTYAWLMLVGIILVACVGLVPATADDKVGQAKNEEAIKAVLATYEETWNKHDMSAWGKLFTDDVDYVNRFGVMWKGNKTNW